MSKLIGALLLFAIAMPAGSEDAPVRDPTQPYRPVTTPGARGSTPRRFELTAVLISSERKIAVINGAFHREGDWIDGAQITRIELQAVRLQRGSEETVVRLNQERTKLQIIRGDPSS